MSAAPQSKYLQTLAEYLSKTRLEDLPQHVIERGLRITADSVAAIVAGHRIDEMKAFAKRHLEAGGAGRSSVLGTGIRAEPIKAALLNGAAGTWLEQDEGNLHAGGGHPGIQLIPAALAEAQQRGASGADLLLAIILGYEASSRISRASKLKLVFHPHATSGPIGAAVAVAKLAGADAKQMQTTLNASATLGIATSRNAILEGVTVRNAYAGMSNFMGILTRQMVESDFTGEEDAVGVIHGKAYSDSFDRDLVVKDLGSEYVIARSYFKIHSAGRYVHSGLDLIEKAMQGQPGGRIDPKSIERIDFNTYFLAKLLDRKTVTTSFGAKFSIPFAVASFVFHGTADLDNYSEQAVANPVIQALAQRINVTENAEYTKEFPGKQIADMRLLFKDGRVLETREDHMKGENENPHSDADLRGKFVRLTKDTWGEDHAHRVLDAVLKLHEARDFARFADEYRL
jgi:2-methylcitrate dehydratase PrpD